ncbi:hypothetical protein WG622_14960, partial [Cognatishimia sp. D5M38]
PPQTGKDLSRTAANAQSLIEKALALCSAPRFLRQQHVVFPQNQPKVNNAASRSNVGSHSRG